MSVLCHSDTRMNEPWSWGGEECAQEEDSRRSMQPSVGQLPSDSSEDNKPSRKAENLESSHSSRSPMYHKISKNAFDIHGEKVINEKLGSFDEANFSNGIIPIKEIEHLDTVGNQRCFSNPVLSSVNEELSIASSNSEATLDLQGSSPLYARNVNILFI